MEAAVVVNTRSLHGVVVGFQAEAEAVEKERGCKHEQKDDLARACVYQIKRLPCFRVGGGGGGAREDRRSRPTKRYDIR